MKSLSSLSKFTFSLYTSPSNPSKGFEAVSGQDTQEVPPKTSHRDTRVMDNQLSGFDDPHRLGKIDKLMELGVGEYVSLPQLVVVGDQSSGKSSVLEGLTGIPFPRDSTLCTRFATQIVFSRAEKESVSVSIIPSANCSPDAAEELKSFRLDDLTELSAQDFGDILAQACDAMGIPAHGEEVEDYQTTFSSNILKIELFGPKHNHLSVIDVPGIFRTITEGVTSNEDKALVIDMVRRFIQNERTIILAVLPANVDIATQEILSMAKEVDSQGQRTLGVLTKPDLVDRGAEGDIINLVQGKKHKLRLGFCVVRNRGQYEASISTAERHRNEMSFFSNGPFSVISKDRLGIPALQARLRELLNDITQREFPHVKREINIMLSKCEKDLQNLGPSRQSEEQQRKYLLEMSVKFQNVSRQAMEARYDREKFFDEEKMRLATRIIGMNEDFAEEMASKGCTVQFEEPDITSVDTPARIHRKSASSEKRNGNKHDLLKSDILKLYPELQEVLQDAQDLSDPGIESVMIWIKEVFESSRGFVLGTFEPMILPLLFKEQTVHWEDLAMTYINGIIFHVHRFCKSLLSDLCPDHRVRGNLWSILVEELLTVYHRTIAHLKLILNTERLGNLTTLNFGFTENMEIARTRRLEEAMKEVDLEYGDSVMIEGSKMKELLRSKQESDREHTIKDIHDILFSYYKVALQRFVDNACLQVTDYNLVSGPETPLRVFSPTFVGNLTSSQLELIAAEDSVSAVQRRQLGERIERLKEGRKVLAS